MALGSVVRQKVRKGLRFASAYAIQLWTATGFLFMAAVAPFATAPRYAAVWPYLFALLTVLVVASIARPEARILTAATGSLVAMVGVARVIAIAEWYWPVIDEPHVLLHLLLWGLHIVVGIKWPMIAHDSSLRHLVEQTRGTEPPDILLEG